MATLNSGSKWTGDVTLTKRTGTKLNLPLTGKYGDREVEFTLGVQSAVAAGDTAAADADVVSGSTAGGTNISGVIGQKTTTEPSSGYFIRVDASGSGNSKITSAGWIDTGSLSAAQATATKYFTVNAAGITVSGGGLTATQNYSGTPAVGISLDSQTTTGATIQDSQPASGYYIKLTGNSGALNGTTKVKRAKVQDVRTAGYLPARALTDLLDEAEKTASVSIGAGSKTRYLVIPAGSAATPATAIAVTPSVSVNSSTGLVTAAVSGSKSVTPSVSEGYVKSGTAGTVSVSGSGTLQLDVKAATTYPVSASDRTIEAGQYLTGGQLIRGVTCENISATKIRAGVVAKVGDSASPGRIKNVTGTFSAANTVSSGQTAAGAAQIMKGYSAFVDGEEVQGSFDMDDIFGVGSLWATDKNVTPESVLGFGTWEMIRESDLTHGDMRKYSHAQLSEDNYGFTEKYKKTVYVWIRTA